MTYRVVNGSHPTNRLGSARKIGRAGMAINLPESSRIVFRNQSASARSLCAVFENRSRIT